MTRNKNKKRLVRARMAKTGEGYQTAHRMVVAAVEAPAAAGAAPPPPPAPPPESAPGPRSFHLQYLGNRFALGERSFTIGRQARCELPIDDSLASRRHATFQVHDGVLRVEDHASRNGVDVNGKRIAVRAELAHGDVVLIGRTELLVVEDGKPVPERNLAVAPPARAPVSAVIGASLAGRYKLRAVVPIPETKIGGEPKTHYPCELFDAQHALLGGDVNVKVLTFEGQQSAGAQQRWWLLQEGRAQQRAQHPQVLRVFDIGETEAGEVYLVLEPAPGTTLGAYMEKKGPDPRLVHEVMRQMAVILEHVHAKGVVHRGLRNGVVHVVERPSGKIELMLSSFSFATFIGERPPVPEGAVYGHPSWMSPEQCRGEEVDARSDLYSLGVMLYTMLTQRLPFEGEDKAKLLELQINAAPPPLDAAGSPPTGLDAICMKLLAKSPDARYASATELLAALDATPRTTLH